jgi:hypothetical protein
MRPPLLDVASLDGFTSLTTTENVMWRGEGVRLRFPLLSVFIRLCVWGVFVGPPVQCAITNQLIRFWHQT